MALKPTDEPGKAGSDSPRRKVGKKSAEAGKSKAASSSKETTKVAATSAQRGGTKADQADRARVDEKTVKRIEALGESVVRQSLKLTDPFVDVPTRSISNVKFNKSKRLLEMGDAKQRRTLFNLGQAKKFMQTMLIADGCRDLVRAGKTLSLRGMYYKSLHTISGTKEKTFDGQDE